MTLSRRICFSLSCLALSFAFNVHAQDAPAYGPELQGFDYPYPFSFSSQRQVVQMAYMDVHPVHPNGRTAVLLHGKNFCAATWKQTIDTLSDAGYRVIAPDQDRLLQIDQARAVSVHVPAIRA